MNETSIVAGATHVITYATMLDRNFRWQGHDVLKLSSLMEKQVKGGSLLRGR